MNMMLWSFPFIQPLLLEEVFLFLLKWANPGLFFIFLQSLQKNNTIFTTNHCEKMSCPSSIQCRDSNPWPLEHESAPITTRPGLPPKFFILVIICFLHFLVLIIWFVGSSIPFRQKHFCGCWDRTWGRSHWRRWMGSSKCDRFVGWQQRLSHYTHAETNLNIIPNQCDQKKIAKCL